MRWKKAVFTSMSAVAMTAFTMGVSATAATAMPVSDCRDQDTLEIAVPGESETVTVNAVACVEVDGDRIRGYSYTAWKNPFAGQSRFHEFTLVSTVDREADRQVKGDADTDDVQLTCTVDLTRQINREKIGGGHCSTEWFDFGGKPGYSGDGSIDYSVKRDGKGMQSWWFWGPPYTD